MKLLDWDITAVGGHVEKYREKVKQFGLTPLLESEKALIDYPDILDRLRRLGVWALQNPTPLLEAIRMTQPICVFVGFKPTRFHVGHLTLARELAWYLDHGAVPFFVVSGFEANTSLSNDEARKRVLEFWKIVQVFGNKGHKEPEHVYSDKESMGLHAFTDLVEAQVQVKKVFQLYGWKPDITVSTLRVATVDAASFLFPQRLLPRHRVVVLSDINQVTHSEMAKFIARKLGLSLPTFSYRMLVQSLLGPGNRMSVRDEASTIFLGESQGSTEKKLSKCFSGGRKTVEEQRLHGGDPYICSFFGSCAAFLEDAELSNILEGCVSGRSICGECKAQHKGVASEKLTQLAANAYRTRGGG